MKVLNENHQNPITDFVCSLRKKAIGKKREFTNEQLEKPVSFWTKTDELEFVYEKIWNKSIPISLGITPFAVKSYFSSYRDTKFYQDQIA